VTHVTVIFFHSVWLYMPLLFLHTAAVKSPWFALECHPISVLFSCALGLLACPSYLVSQFSSLFFPLSGHWIRRERRRNCPCTMCDLILLF
jgi:hypothetical protein